MTWRIKSIVLYQRDGVDRRTLNFNTHGLNIITGDSGTGKSAVLDILDYILMSRSCPIPKGIIRQAVSHVGGHLVGPEGELLILRPLPAPSKKMSTQGWYKLGRNLKFPDEIPDMKSNRAGVRDILSPFTGIAGATILSNPKEPWEEVKAEVNIRHAAPLIFQPQDVIANRYVSVPGLDSENHRRHMIDALPFLLGIEDVKMLAARARLRVLKSKLRELKMRGKERQRLGAKTFDRGYKLWLEAQGIGLLEGPTPETVPALLTVLRDFHVDEQKRFNIATEVPDIHKLEAQEMEARKSVQEMRKRIRSLREFERSVEVYQDVVSRQRNKLSISELLPNHSGSGNCPICNSDVFDPTGHREQLLVTLSSLSEIHAIPLRVDAKVRKVRVRLEKELIPIEEQHEADRSKLRAAVAKISKNAEYFASERNIDRLLGRISEYIRTIDVGDMDEDEEDLEALTVEIELLQKKLDSIWMHRKKTQEAVDKTMTALARRMEVEFQKGYASISVEDLSIKVQVDPDSDELTSLAEIGSGANWVSYHLAGILSIHDHLSRNNCPVPRTLLIDQPSQAWFPQELRITDREGDLLPKKAEDTNRVREIYRILGEMASNETFSQIIVMDHAKFSDSWFEDMICYEWRLGEKLVPEHWITDSAS